MPPDVQRVGAPSRVQSALRALQTALGDARTHLHNVDALAASSASVAPHVFSSASLPLPAPSTAAAVASEEGGAAIIPPALLDALARALRRRGIDEGVLADVAAELRLPPPPLPPPPAESAAAAAAAVAAAPLAAATAIDVHVVRAHTPPPRAFLHTHAVAHGGEQPGGLAHHPAHAHAHAHAHATTDRHVSFGSDALPPSPPPALRHVRFTFPRVRADARAIADDGLAEDIPLVVSELPEAVFLAAEEAAAAERERARAARDAGERSDEDAPAAAAATVASGSGGGGEDADADDDDDDDDEYTIHVDAAAPAVRAWRAGDAAWLPPAAADAPPVPADALFEAFQLRVVCLAGRTGFEEAKEFHAPVGSVIAGRFRVTDFLGAAAFSTALACVDLADGARVCLKVIKGDSKDYLDQSLDEIKLLRYLNAQGDADAHHVLRLRDYFYFAEHLFLVTELLQENLFELQRSLAEAGEPAYFTLPRVQRIARQLLHALDFLAGRGLLHCDVKPENVLIASFSACAVKLIDFGSSCFVTDALSSYIQSRSYRAPEVALGLPYGPKIDVWSLGCVLAELLTGQVLFPNESLQAILARMAALCGAFPRHMRERGSEAQRFFTADGRIFERDEEAATVRILTPCATNLRLRLRCEDEGFLDFVAALLTLDPARRPTAAQALQHPWLRHEYGDEAAPVSASTLRA